MKDKHQLDRRRHQAHAYRAKQNQPVIFPGTNLLHFHVLERTEDDQSGNPCNQDVEEGAECIYLDHGPESQARELRLVKRCRNRRHGADQRDEARAVSGVLRSSTRGSSTMMAMPNSASMISGRIRTYSMP